MPEEEGEMLVKVIFGLIVTRIVKFRSQCIFAYVKEDKHLLVEKGA